MFFFIQQDWTIKEEYLAITYSSLHPNSRTSVIVIWPSGDSYFSP